MLAGILTLLQDDDDQPTVLPMVKIDRGGGGGPNVPMYLIGDYAEVLATFREVGGEHPVARAVRRDKHLQNGLRQRLVEREQKERDLAAAMLLGAQLGHAVAFEEAVDRARHVATNCAAKFDAMRLRAERAEQRGGGDIGAGGVIVLLALGVGVGILIARRRSKHQTEAS